MFDNKIFDNSGGGGALTPGTTPVVGGVEHAVLYIDSAIIQGSANLTYSGTRLTLTDSDLAINYVWDDYTWGGQFKYLGNFQMTFESTEPGPGTISMLGVNSGYSINAANRKGGIWFVGYNQQLQDNTQPADETWYCYGWFRVSGTSNVADGDTVTIGTTVYTFRNTLALEGDVKISTTQFLSLSNLGAAINGTGTYGVNHQCTAAHADVECSGVYTSHVNLRTRVAGSAGETIALNETSLRLSRSAATMLRQPASVYSAAYGYKGEINLYSVPSGPLYGLYQDVVLGSYHGANVTAMTGIDINVSAQSSSATPTRGTMTGAKIGCYNNGGIASTMNGILCELALNNDGATSFGTVSGTVYGIKIANISTGPVAPGTVAGTVIGLSIPDLTGFGSAFTYGIQQLGYMTNYFEGPMTFLSLQTGGVVTAAVGTGALGLVTDAAGVLTSDGSGNLSFAAVVAGAAGNDTNVQYNDGGSIAGADSFTFDDTNIILTLARTANDAFGPSLILQQSRGVAGVDADVVGTISFKGYNDASSPQLIEYCRISADIRDASDGYESGSLAFSFMHSGVLKEMLKLSVAGGSGYFTYFDIKTPSGAGVGPVLRVYTLENSGAALHVDGRGGDGQIVLTDQLTAKWSFGHSVTYKGMYLISGQSGYYQFSTVVESATKENWIWGGAPNTAIPATANRNILYANVGVAPSAAPVDAVATWCADYGTGDARLYIMGEASTNKTVIGSGVIELQALQADANGSSLVFLKNRGAAGQDADVLGKISFKGYNDNATPELTEFAYIAGIMHDASDTTEDGGIALYTTLAGTSRKVYQTDQYAGYLTHHFYGCNWGGAWTPIGNSTATMIIEAYYTNALYMNCSVDNRIEFYTNAGASANGMLYCNYQVAYLVNYGTQIGGVPDASIGLWGGTGCIQLNAPLPYSYYINDANARSILGWHSNSPVAPTTVSADVVQMWVADYAAADARLYLMGEKNTNKIALGAGGMLLDSSLADDSYSGVTITGTAGEDLAFGDVCYRKSDGKYWKADANQATTMPGVVLCLQAIDESVSATGEFLKYGFIRDDSWTAWTVGGLLYVSAAATGAMVQTAPSGAGDQVQVLGYAYSAKVIFFNPSYVMVEV